MSYWTRLLLGKSILLGCLLLCFAPRLLLAGRLVLQNNALYGYSDTTDAWLNEGNQDANNGGDTTLFIRYDMYDGGYAEDCSLVRFTLPTVTSDGLTAAALALYYRLAGSMQNDNVLTVKPYRLTASWYENTGTNLNNQGVSWLYRDQYQTQSWTYSYGSWYDKVDDLNGVNRVKKTGGSGSGIEPLNWVPFDVLPSVQQWLGGTANYGFVLFSSAFEGGGTVVHADFDSKEYTDATTRPKLTLTYRNARLLWAGGVSGTWDTSTVNWTIGGLNGFYDNGDFVRFDSGTRTNITVTAGGVAPGLVIFTNATSRFTFSGGAIGGTNGLSKYCAGEVRLAAPNSYSGLTDLYGGTLIVATNQALGSTATGTVVRSGATLLIEGGVTYDATEALSLSGSGAAGTGALLTTPGTSRFAGPITLAASADIGAPSTATLTLTGAIGGSAAWRKVGNGTVTLSGTTSNTFGGTLTVQNGTLRLAKSGCVAIPTTLAVGDGSQAVTVFVDAANPFATTATVSVAANALLDLQAFPASLAALVMSGGRVTAAGGILSLVGPFDYTGTVSQASVGGLVDLKAERTFTIADGTAEEDVVIEAQIVSGAFVKAGPGTLGFRAANLYTGGTTIQGGTLLVTNNSGSATGTGSVLVKSGATLAGSGLVSGTVTVEDNGRIVPGRTGAGSLSLGKLALSINSCLLFDLAAPGGTNDELAISGDLTLAGALQVVPGPSFGIGRYRLLTYGGKLNYLGLAVTGLPMQYDSAVDTKINNEVWLDIAETPEHFVASSGLNIAPYTNWTIAAHTLQDALDVTRSGDTVWASNGVYATGGKIAAFGGSLTNRVYVPEMVTLRSLNGPSQTIIAGAPDPVLTNGPAAVRGVLLAPGASLIGFTVTNGFTALTGFSPWDTDGGGVLAMSASISNCIVAGCSAWRGGGISIQGQPAGGFALRYVRVSGNRASSAGGGICSDIGTLGAVSCLVANNQAGNQGGGIASSGGVNLYCLTVVSNTVATAGQGGGVWVSGSSLLFDSILYANLALVGNNVMPPASFHATTCCSQPLLSGLGNITDDPAFRAPALGDFRLRYKSPCVDTATGFANGAADLDGLPRPLDGNFDSIANYDMGAFEYAPWLSDSDGDSMPDAWEHVHGLRPLDPADATDNPDNDAFDNLSEYIADTAPQDRSSTFSIVAISNAPLPEIWFTSSVARVYTLWQCAALTNRAWAQIPGQVALPGHGGLDHLSDNGGATNRFYRLSVELPSP